jgi:ribonuclease P protein component
VLPKKNRLSRHAFLQTKLNGHKQSNRYFYWTTAVNRLEFNRYSVIIPKKIQPRATYRNTIKRTFYSLLPQTSRGLDVIIYPQKPSLTLTQPELRLQLKAIIST